MPTLEQPLIPFVQALQRPPLRSPGDELLVLPKGPWIMTARWPRIVRGHDDVAHRTGPRWPHEALFLRRRVLRGSEKRPRRGEFSYRARARWVATDEATTLRIRRGIVAVLRRIAARAS